jgi:hypothetical protein
MEDTLFLEGVFKANLIPKPVVKEVIKTEIPKIFDRLSEWPADLKDKKCFQCDQFMVCRPYPIPVCEVPSVDPNGFAVKYMGLCCSPLCAATIITKNIMKTHTRNHMMILLRFVCVRIELHEMRIDDAYVLDSYLKKFGDIEFPPVSVFRETVNCYVNGNVPVDEYYFNLNVASEEFRMKVTNLITNHITATESDSDKILSSLVDMYKNFDVCEPGKVDEV